jgi:hypothetical protein
MNRRHFIKNTAMITTAMLAGNLTSASEPQNGERNIYKILSASDAHLGSLALKNVIRGNYKNYVSPFFILDEFGPMMLPKGSPFRVDAHPHAGIIPTTYLFAGNAHHRDSMGNDFQYHEGDFIQFTSGRGALHMEETGDELYENGGNFHGIQSWLNIPSHLKKSEPQAGHIRKEDISVVETESVIIRVILGEVFGVRSKLDLLMPVIYWHISAKGRTTLELPADASQNVFVYLLNGQLNLKGDQELKPSQVALYERDGGFIRIKTDAAADFLVLGGEVNNEAYAADGPFVLNSIEELQQAYADFHAGKYGDLDKTNGIRRG